MVNPQYKSDPENQEIQNFRADANTGYTLVFTRRLTRADYVVYEFIRNDREQVLYSLKGSTGREWTDLLELAEPFIQGMINADGCMDWRFYSSCHSCNRSSLYSFTSLLLFIHDEGLKNMTEASNEALKEIPTV